jgi:hypothetical protein
MDHDEKEMLKKTLELAGEYNKMLHSIRRNMFWGRVTSTVYWIIIIGAAVGVYYYIDPYINSAISAYGNMKGDIKTFGDLFNLKK